MTRWGGVVAGLLATSVLALPVRAGEPPLEALARVHVGADQGVFVDAEDGTVLAAVVADRAVHPASVTKVATTLALLDRLGPAHRFATRIDAAGRLHDGRLDGDLVLHGANDPFFVFESAFLVLRRLHALGIRRVAGTVRVDGPFLFNWQPDPAGARLRRALAGRDGREAWTAVGGDLALANAALVLGEPKRRGGGPQPVPASRRTDAVGSPLLTYRSPPLLQVLKACNGYSNNVLHHASDAIGGPRVVEAVAREAVPPDLRDEITIDNGAGAGATNRLSPRAATAILRALARRARALGHEVTDLLPVSGVDPGTLAERLPERPRLVVGKTGTFGSVGASALVGLVRSAHWGTVAFAVLNHGVPVPEARARQDAFVRALADAVGAEPWPYQTPARPAYGLALVE